MHLPRSLVLVSALLVALLATVAPAHAQPLDAAFNPGVNADVFTLAAQPDGKILAGGNFTTIAGVARPRLARLNANGTVDTDFNPAPPAACTKSPCNPTGKSSSPAISPPSPARPPCASPGSILMATAT